VTKPATAITDDISGAASTRSRVHVPRHRIADYALLLKPRVMSLVVFTGIVGLALAPGMIDWLTTVAAVTCIALGAGAAGAINMWYDRDIDLHMRRTMNRPLPAGRLHPREALTFGVLLALVSVAAMARMVNGMAAALLAITILYYVVIYTIWLKRRTPQNIVIGGASGALPPVIGWAAVTGDVGLGAVILFGIIFLWTPPHSWALALFRCGDYETAGVPMMPVIAGERTTKRLMLVYTWLLVPVTLLPVVIGMSGALYGCTAAFLGGAFVDRVWRVWRNADQREARSLFFFSILYLFLIFVGLLADRILFYPVF
jgi:protoheme IX farnesyltransferase